MIADDQCRYKQIFDRHYDRVFNLCVRMLHNYHDAQDITQEVFIRVHRNLGSLKEDAGISSWIYRVAVNACLDHIRREKSWLTKAQKWFAGQASHEASPERKILELDEGMRILKQLSPSSRAVMTLKLYLDLSYNEIAHILNMTPAGVGVQLTRARKEARRAAENEGIKREM